MKKEDILFLSGIAIMGIGTVAMDSPDVGGIIAAASVIIGIVVATAGYLIKRLNDERKETNRRCEEIRRRKAG